MKLSIIALSFLMIQWTTGFIDENQAEKMPTLADEESSEFEDLEEQVKKITLSFDEPIHLPFAAIGSWIKNELGAGAHTNFEFERTYSD